MGNNESCADNDEVNEHSKLKAYEKLMSMGFNDDNAFQSATKYPTDLQKAVDYAIKQENNDETSTEPQYEGSIFVIPHIKKLWGILQGTMMNFYLDKNSLYDIPYDVVDVSQFYQTHKCSFNHQQIPFGIQLCDEHDEVKLVHAFENVDNRDKWYESLHQITIKNRNKTDGKAINGDIDNNNIIYNGFALIDKKKLSFMELRNDDNILYIYDNNMTKPTTINLENFKNIKCYEALGELVIDDEMDGVITTIRKSFWNGFNKTRHKEYGCKNTLFSYGLILEEKDGNHKNDKLLLFKSNNERHEWLAHIDFLIENKLNTMNGDNSATETILCADHHDDINDIEILSSALKLYQDWINDENKEKESLSLVLRKKLNVNYLSILNHFHSISANDNIIITTHDNCDANMNECGYALRHISRDKNAMNDDDKDNVDHKGILCELLDTIHCFIYHSNDSNGITRTNMKDKFVIKTLIIPDDVKTDDDDVLDDDGEDNDDEKHDDIDYVMVDANNNDSVTFAFGESFNYDCSEIPNNYIVPKFQSLKKELISNPYYKININKYNKYYLKSVQLKNSDIFKNLTATASNENLPIPTVKIGDPITINHIISLMIYCNETEAQKVYKQHTRKLYHNEALKNIYQRQSYIANWTRYLTESCVFYGKSMTLNEVVYCGMDRKLLFNTFEFENYSPLSTSSSLIVANNFAQNEGIILKLQRTKGLSTDCRYFDMIPISNFNEKEKFFCGWSKLKIMDIMIEGKSNKNKISSLTLLQKILNGTLFYYEWNAHLISDEVQNILCQLLSDYVEQKNQTNYFQKLTNKLIDSFINRNKEIDIFGAKVIFINLTELRALNNSLTQYFIPITSTEQALLFRCNNFKNVKINYNENYWMFHINKGDIHQLTQYMENGYHHPIDIGKTIIVNGYKFQLKFGPWPIDNEQCFAVWIYLKSGISSTIHIKMLWDVICKEIGYENINHYVELLKGSNYSYAIKAFMVSDIKQLHSFSLDVNIRILEVSGF